jgi:hypothetical protein
MASTPPPQRRSDPFPRLGVDWSDPQPIPVVLKRLGMVVPQRLRTVRFQEMIAALDRLGIEAQGGDG